MRNKDTIGGRGWNIAAQERIIYVEIEFVTFVINGSVKLIDRSKSRYEAEVLLSAVSLISSSTGYILPW